MSGTTGPDLLPVSEALERVLAETPVLGPERVPLPLAPGRVLASDVVADADVPPFDRCAMDGYAVRSADVAEAPTSLRVVGTLAAGSVRTDPVAAGQAVKVMTGAPLPPGCDAVLPVERARQDGPRVLAYEPVAAGQHVSPRGEDLRAGAVALPRGVLVGSLQVGLLAVVGRAEVEVHARPSACVISTGDELVDLGRCGHGGRDGQGGGVAEAPGPGRIRNSNGPMLAALAAGLGCDPVEALPAVGDDPPALERVLRRGLQARVLLVSGGVSKGDRDFVGGVLERLGVAKVFHGVAIQPGKPLWFGRTADGLVFALPGNPVSAWITATLFAGAAVRRMRGLAEPWPRPVRARLAEGASRHPGRTGYLPARVERTDEGLCAEPLSARGSADLATACRANATWIAPAGRDSFRKGEVVSVLLHADFFER